MPTNSTRRRRRARRSVRQNPRVNLRHGFFEELKIVNLAPNSTISFVVPDFGLPARRNFRISYVRVEAFSVNSGGAATPSYSSSAIIEFQIQAPHGAPPGIKIVCTSGPRCVGPNPRLITLRSPPSMDWTQFDIDSTVPLVRVENICTANGTTTGVSGRISAVMRIGIALQPEDIIATCPTIYSEATLNDDFDHLSVNE